MSEDLRSAPRRRRWLRKLGWFYGWRWSEHRMRDQIRAVARGLLTVGLALGIALLSAGLAKLSVSVALIVVDIVIGVVGGVIYGATLVTRGGSESLVRPAPLNALDRRADAEVSWLRTQVITTCRNEFDGDERAARLDEICLVLAKYLATWEPEPRIIEVLNAAFTCIPKVHSGLFTKRDTDDCRWTLKDEVIKRLCLRNLVEEQRHSASETYRPDVAFGDTRYREVTETTSYSEFRWTEFGRAVAHRLQARDPAANLTGIVVDATSWRRHTTRVKAWVRQQNRCLEANGIPYPGHRIELTGDGDASLFRQHFSEGIAKRVEGWNAIIVKCNNAFKAAEIRAAAQNNMLGLAHEMNGWPFRMMVIEHAGGLPVRVETINFEWGDGCIIDRASGEQVHPLPGRRLNEGDRSELLAALERLKSETADWPETLALGEAWREVQRLRIHLSNDFGWIETLERLPGSCDRCPDRQPVRT